MAITPPAAPATDNSYQGLIYADADVVAYEVDNHLTGLSMSTGKRLWDSQAANSEAASTSAAGRIFTYDNAENTAEALDPRTGHRLYGLNDARADAASTYPN